MKYVLPVQVYVLVDGPRPSAEAVGMAIGERLASLPEAIPHCAFVSVFDQPVQAVSREEWQAIINTFAQRADAVLPMNEETTP